VVVAVAVVTAVAATADTRSGAWCPSTVSRMTQSTTGSAASAARLRRR
jgi:hypothetical protein